MVSWLSSDLGVCILVIKIGGSISEKADVIANEIPNVKEQVVVVHGEGPQATKLEKALGRETRYIYSKSGFKSRYTDLETINNMVMASSSVNNSIVQKLRKNGVDALGISGTNGIILAKRKVLINYENGKETVIRDDYSGKITRIEAKILKKLLDEGITPVIAPIGVGDEFEPLNVDGDRAAAAIAAELKASKLLILTDVGGFYSNFPNGLVPSVKQNQIEAMQEKASGGMKRKLVAASEALSGSVKEVIISSGLVENPISAAISGAGTHFTM